MAPPPLEARIRCLTVSDEKTVKFAIAKSIMEGLAVSNIRAYTHPITVSVWIGLSCIFVQFMHWWPSQQNTALGFLKPLPGFAAICVPILVLVDWFNRPYFEDMVASILKGPDLKGDLVAYYSRSPSSGFWILEYGGSYIGHVSVDTEDRNAAIIRHIYVDEPYRPSGVQEDLIKHAVDHAFRNTSSLERIQTTDSPLQRYIQRSLRDAGFKLERQKTDKKVGIAGWVLGTRTLERVLWSNMNSEK